MASTGEENGVRIQSSSLHNNMNYYSQAKTRISDPRLTTLQVTSYHECLKNHAANTGGNVTDGCGEFMPSGEEGTVEALKCAACGCHRSFHRKYNRGLLPPPLPSPSMIQRRWTSTVQPGKVAFKGDGRRNGQRTKFTAEQKEKMLGFAEKLGWRLPREDDTQVHRFCGEVGVTRHVFKVWMHNNKISSKKTNFGST